MQVSPWDDSLSAPLESLETLVCKFPRRRVFDGSELTRSSTMFSIVGFPVTEDDEEEWREITSSR